MRSNALFVEELLRRVPELKPIYDRHIADNDGLLPHVFMGDVTRFAIAAGDTPGNRESLPALLACLEDGLRTGADDVGELIRAAFVENLIGEGAAINALRPLMGKNLRAEVERICR